MKIYTQKNILWIDDDLSGPLIELKHRVEFRLGLKGFKLSIAENYFEAKEIIKKVNFDLIISDLRISLGSTSDIEIRQSSLKLEKEYCEGKRNALGLGLLFEFRKDFPQIKLVGLSNESRIDVEPIFQSINAVYIEKGSLNVRELCEIIFNNLDDKIK